MPSLSPAALQLAGFALAHAAWSISDTGTNELLTPVALIESEGERRVLRFEAATQEEAVGNGKAAMAEATPTADAWAFAREGSWRAAADGEAQDVLAVDFWARGMDAPATVVQPFARAGRNRPFRLLGAAALVVGGRPVDAAAAGPALATLREGIRAHSKAAELWPAWRAASAAPGEA
jgi:hypothetical protein